MKNKKTDSYKGFEQGPIRPPSEANQITPDNVEQFTAEVMKRFI